MQVKSHNAEFLIGLTTRPALTVSKLKGNTLQGEHEVLELDSLCNHTCEGSWHIIVGQY